MAYRGAMDDILFERLGGATALRGFVASFYAHMRELEIARDIHAMHTRPLEDIAERLFAFLCGFTGGPALYHTQFGPPMMRARHLPFPIDEAARDAWLACAFDAAEETLDDTPARAEFLARLQVFADHMRNR